MSKPLNESLEPSPNFDPHELIAKVYRVLRDLQLQPILIGGQAVILHGHVRYTRDADFSVLASPQDAQAVVEQLTSLDCRPKYPEWQTSVQLSMVLPLNHVPTKFGIDISFVPSEYLAGCLTRASTAMISSQAVPMLSVEDLVIHKVVAGRPQDVTDAVELLSRYPEYNDALIRLWLPQFAEVIEEPLIERYESWLAEARK